MPGGLEEILERVAAVAREIVAPDAARVDREGAWPEKALRALQAEGLGGLVVPASLGGLGQGLLGVARVGETLGRACASTSMCFGMHNVGSAVLSAKATPDHAERYLRPIARGEHLTTLALSEPGTGSLFYVPETQLHHAGDGFLLRGAKAFVTNGGRADSHVVSAATAGRDAVPGQFSCVVLPAKASGLSWGPAWNGSGMRGNSSRRLDLHDVHVPRRDLLGEEGDQVWYVFNVIAPYFLVAMAGTYLGVAASALDEAREHLTRRRHATTGAPLAAHPVVQHRLGTLWAEVERTRRLVYHAAAAGDAGAADAMPALFSAKAEVADAAVHVANEALTLLGGIGYEQGSSLDRHLRDARAAPVMAPTTDLLRTWTGRALLGEPLLSE